MPVTTLAVTVEFRQRLSRSSRLSGGWTFGDERRSDDQGWGEGITGPPGAGSCLEMSGVPGSRRDPGRPEMISCFQER